MNALLNRIFLLALSCCFLFFIPFDTTFIFLLFMAVTISCLNYYFLKNTKFCVGSTILFALLSCFFPYAFCFFPLMAYDIIHTKSLLACIAYSIVLTLPSDIQTPAQAIFLLVSFIASILLYHHARTYNGLETQFRQSRDDSAELQALLQEKNHTLIQKQNAEIYAARLKERNRIAREIHDSVGHLLSRSILVTGALKSTNTQAPLTSNIQVLEETLTSAMDSIRNSVHNLHERSIDLPNTLEILIRDYHDYDISFNYDVQSEMTTDLKYMYIAIVKEGLTNIIKHSNATKITLVLREHPSLYQFILHDNGTTRPSTTSSGIGLLGIKERIDARRGNFQLTTDAGFRIFFTIPKQGDLDENTDY